MNFSFLVFVSIYFFNFRAKVAGWGTIYFGGPTSSRLQEVEVGIWRNSDCDRNYGRLDRNVLDTMLCAGDTTGKDACQVSLYYDFKKERLFSNFVFFTSLFIG